MKRAQRKPPRRERAILRVLWDLPPRDPRVLPVFERLGAGGPEHEVWLVPRGAFAEQGLAELARERGAELRALEGGLPERAREIADEVRALSPAWTVAILPSVVTTTSAGVLFSPRADFTSLVIMTKLRAAIRGASPLYFASCSDPDLGYRAPSYAVDRLIAATCAESTRRSGPLFELSSRWDRGFRRALRRPRYRAPARERARIVHSVCSMGVGGTQRQLSYFLDAGIERRFEHVVLSSNHDFDFWEGAQPLSEVGREPAARQDSLVTRPNRRLGDLLHVPRLVATFKRLQPDLVMGWGHEQAVSAHLAAAMVGVPCFVYGIRALSDCLDYQGDKGELLRSFHRRTAQRRAATVTNSSPSRDDYARWIGLPAGEITLIANGMSPAPSPSPGARERLRAQLGVGSDELLLATVGRLTSEKGHGVLLGAFARLETQHPLLIVGDGPDLPALQEQARSLGLSERVHFVGFQQNVDDWLAASDLFVLPSFTEGMPNAVMEAMRSELPIVATARGGTLDLIRPDVDGVLVEPTSDSLAAGLRRLLASPALRAELASSAGARVRAEFSAQAMVRRYEELFARLLGV